MWLRLRCFASSNDSSGWSWRVFDRIYFQWQIGRYIFLDEGPFSISLPIWKFVRILLQMFGINSEFYSHVCNRFICKLTYNGAWTNWYFVYILQKKMFLCLPSFRFLKTSSINSIYWVSHDLDLANRCLKLRIQLRV